MLKDYSQEKKQIRPIEMTGQNMDSMSMLYVLFLLLQCFTIANNMMQRKERAKNESTNLSRDICKTLYVRYRRRDELRVVGPLVMDCCGMSCCRSCTAAPSAFFVTLTLSGVTEDQGVRHISIQSLIQKQTRTITRQ